MSAQLVFSGLFGLSANKWLCIILDWPLGVPLKEHLLQDQFFLNNLMNVYFEVLRTGKNFVHLKAPIQLCCSSYTWVKDWSPVIYIYVMHVFWSTALVILKQLFAPIKNHHLQILLHFMGSNENKIMLYFIYAGGTNALCCHGPSQDDISLLLFTQHHYFRT